MCLGSRDSDPGRRHALGFADEGHFRRTTGQGRAACEEQIDAPTASTPQHAQFAWVAFSAFGQWYLHSRRVMQSLAIGYGVVGFRAFPTKV